MGIDKLSDADLEEAADQIQEFLSHGLDVQDVSAVEAEEVEARTGGKGAAEQLDDYSVFYRVKVYPVQKQSVVDARSDVTSHIRDQLESMEQNSSAPDTHLVAVDNPPAHINTKPLVFYVMSVL